MGPDDFVYHLPDQAIAQVPLADRASARLLDQLAVPEDARTFACLGPDHALKAGMELPKPEGVFPRYENGKKAEEGD